MIFESKSQIPHLDPKLGPLPVQKLADWLVTTVHHARKNAWVHGPRHAGRSSLAAAVVERLKQVGCVPLRLALATVLCSESTKYDSLRLANAISANLRSILLKECRISLPQGKGTGDASEVLAELHQALKEQLAERTRAATASGASAESYVLLVEDFDSIAWLSNGSILYEFVHALAGEMKGTLVVCVLSVLSPSELGLLVQPQGATSPPDRDALWQLEEIEDLTRAELVVAYRPTLPAGDPLVEPVLNAIHRWTNGHHLMTQRLCSYLKLDWQSLQDVVAPAADKLDAVELFVDKAARELLLRTESLKDFVELTEAKSILAWTNETILRERASPKEPDLAAFARALGNGTLADQQGPKWALAPAVLKLAGVAAQRDGAALLPRNRVLETWFSPERIQIDLGKGAAMTAAQGEDWLQGLGAGPGSAVQVIRKARLDAEGARLDAEKASKHAIEQQGKAHDRTSLMRSLSLGLTVLLLVSSTSAWGYRRETRQIEVEQKVDEVKLIETITDSEGDTAARVKALEQEAIKRERELSDAVALAEGKAKNLSDLKDKAERARKEAAHDSAFIKALAAKKAKEDADAAQREVDAAESRRKTAETAKQAADAAAQRAQADHEKLVRELNEQVSASDGAKLKAIRALADEAARRKEAEQALDVQRNNNAEQQKRLDACEAAKRRAEAEAAPPPPIPGGSTGTGG